MARQVEAVFDIGDLAKVEITVLIKDVGVEVFGGAGDFLSRTVHAIEINQRRSVVLDNDAIFVRRQVHRIECQIVIQELADESKGGGYVRAGLLAFVVQNPVAVAWLGKVRHQLGVDVVTGTVVDQLVKETGSGLLRGGSNALGGGRVGGRLRD